MRLRPNGPLDTADAGREKYTRAVWHSDEALRLAPSLSGKQKLLHGAAEHPPRNGNWRTFAAKFASWRPTADLRRNWVVLRRGPRRT